MAWLVELPEFDSQHKPRTIIKAQAFVYILVEMVQDGEPLESRWMLHVNGASSSKGSGVGIILEKEGEIVVELSIKFDFPILNNQAEYKALIAGLQLTNDVSTT